MPDPWTSIRRLVDGAGLGVRRAVVAAGAVVAVVALGALAWLALRPVGSSGGGDDGLFAGSATSLPAGTPPVPSRSAPRRPPPRRRRSASSCTPPGRCSTRASTGCSAGARVADLLDAAGGPTAADRSRSSEPGRSALRRSAPLRAPDRGGGPAGGGGRGRRRRRPGSRRSERASAPSAASPLDLNAATAEQLDTLPGVGPATAAAIVDHRQRNGPFATVDGLLDVRGIGPAKLEAHP